MAWDETEPGPTTKIRNLSGVLTGNFEAIERGDENTGTTLTQRSVQLGDRTTDATSVDPTQETGIVFLYNNASSGAEEIYIRRPTDTAAPIQMSSGAILVPASDNVETSTFLPGGVLMKSGLDTMSSGVNTTTSVTFATAFPNQVYSVIATAVRSGAAGTNAGLGQINANATTTGFVWVNATTGAYDIYWVALGS